MAVPRRKGSSGKRFLAEEIGTFTYDVIEEKHSDFTNTGHLVSSEIPCRSVCVGVQGELAIKTTRAIQIIRSEVLTSHQNHYYYYVYM